MVSQQDGKPLMIEQSRESPRGLGVGLEKAQLLPEEVRSRGGDSEATADGAALSQSGTASRQRFSRATRASLAIVHRTSNIVNNQRLVLHNVPFATIGGAFSWDGCAPFHLSYMSWLTYPKKAGNSESLPLWNKKYEIMD